MKRRSLLAAGPAWAATLAVPQMNLHAQPAWPSGPVRLLVGYAPGGGVDLVARTVGKKLGELVSQQVLVENRAGAAGTIAAEAVTKAAPDGLTLLMASPAEVMSSLIAGQRVRYDPAKDLTPVMLVGETPLVLAAHPSTPAASMSELIAYAKKNPGKLSYGTPGNGSTQHFAGEALKAQAGIFIVHIPYRGAAPALADLVGGQVQLGVVGMPPLVPHAKAGRVRALAVTSEKRSPVMPDVPAMSELPGLAGFRFSNWMGLYAPAATPPAAIAALEQGVAKALADAAVRDALAQAGVEPRGYGPARFGRFIADEVRAYTAVKQKQNISFE
jgi:tripartite-type tricarboxylate transporter receptor subunit TctC